MNSAPIGAGVGRFEQSEQVAQFHPRLTGDAAGAEFVVEIALGQLVEGQAQVGRVRLAHHPQRIEIGAEMAARAVSGDEAAHRALAFVAGAGRRECAARGQTAGFGDGGHDGGVRHIARAFAPFDAVEVRLPLRIDAIGRDQVLFVEIFDIRGVSAELRRLGELLQEAVHSGVALEGRVVLGQEHGIAG